MLCFCAAAPHLTTTIMPVPAFLKITTKATTPPCSLLREINTKGKMRNDGGEGSVRTLLLKGCDLAPVDWYNSTILLPTDFSVGNIAAETLKPDLGHK